MFAVYIRIIISEYTFKYNLYICLHRGMLNCLPYVYIEYLHYMDILLSHFPSLSSTTYIWCAGDCRSILRFTPPIR